MQHCLFPSCFVFLFAAILAPIPSGTLKLIQDGAQPDSCDDIVQGGPDWLQGDEWTEKDDPRKQFLLHGVSENSSFKTIVQDCKTMTVFRQMTLFAKQYDVQYVHVGKTGGSTIQAWLKDNMISFLPIHTRPVTQCIPHERKNWLISVRDPIKRIVSAFNWRHPEYGGAYTMFTKDHGQNPREKELYDCFPHVDGFANALGSNDTCGSIAKNFLRDNQEHVGKGLAFYVGSSLDCLLTQNVFLIHVEKLSIDMSAAIKWLNLTHPVMELRVEYENSDFPMHQATFLSDKGFKHLQNHLEEDYRVLHELEKAFS